jgi:hypothetical protein
MKKILTGISFFLLLLSACKKNSDGGGTEVPEDEKTPLVTAKAETLGPAVTKVIGPAGGILGSADGRLVISVPAGAVSTNTTFGIQPVKSVLDSMADKPNYRLTPHNVTFSKPVRITMKYDPAVVPAGEENLMEMAYQDEAGNWFTMPTELNKTQQTLTIEKPSFSDVEYFERFKLYANPKSLASKQSATLKCGRLPVIGFVDGPNPVAVPNAFKIEGSYYRTLHPQKDVDWVGNWKVVSGGGTIQPRKNAFGLECDAVYVAPDNITEKRFAVVEVELQGLKGFRDPSAPGGLRPMGNMIMRRNIELTPSEFMTLTTDAGDIELENSLQGLFQFGSTTILGNTNAGFSVNIVFKAGAPGSFPCGRTSDAGKAQIVLRMAYQNYWTQFSSCNSPQVTYAPHNLVIDEFGEVGGFIAGHYKGVIYSNNGTCNVESKNVELKFRVKRK